MIGEPEFVRGNQKSYIRVNVETPVIESYEYKMCTYNVLKSLLPFQIRSQNGTNYFYYEVSGMQSMDIYLQTQKLKRPFMLLLAKSMIRLCRELSEYALGINHVMFAPKYIMYAVSLEEIQFLYVFDGASEGYAQIEQLLEYCIEYLSYEDEKLMEQVFQVYERLVEQGENFSFVTEFQSLVDSLTEPDAADDIQQDISGVCIEEPFGAEEKRLVIEVAEQLEESRNGQTAGKEDNKLEKGLLVLLCAGVLGMLLWRPFSLLKFFFFFALGGVLLGLYINRKRRDRNKRVRGQVQNQEYIQEYETIMVNSLAPEDGTQFISVEHLSGVLYNLQGCEPQYIYIGATRKIIGKDAQKVQVHMDADGVSRIHAMVVRDGENCLIEDLCSTNGTWINGKSLEPRCPYVLNQGDKVCFAGLEYIFR